MSEERLIEITTTICHLGGHIWPIVYLTKMEENERELFLKYVASSKFSDRELCYAIVLFSYDYLRSKNISLVANSSQKLKTLEEEEKEVIAYLNSMIKTDEDVQIVGNKIRK